MYEAKDIKRTGELVRKPYMEKNSLDAQRKALEKRIKEGERRYRSLDSGKRVEGMLGDRYYDVQKEIRRLK